MRGKRTGAERPWSLQARLAWRLAAVLIAAVALAGTAIGWRAIAAIGELEDQALQTQAREIRRSIVPDGNGAIAVRLPPEVAGAYARGEALYVVYDAAGRVVARSAADAPARVGPFVGAAGRGGFFETGPLPGGPLFGLETRGDGLSIVVAQGSRHRDVLIDSLLQEFMIAAVWLVGPIGIAAVLVAVLTIRRGLRRVAAISAAAAEIGPERSGLRLPEAGLPIEVRPLVAAVNSALARLERGLEAQRRFTADAAHELRTPLAVLTARLDSIEGEEAAALRRDVARMNRLVGQLLKMARLEALPLDVSQKVDLHEVAAEAIGLLAPLAIRRRQELALSEPDGRITTRGNAPALVVALVNLVENGIGHSPEGSTIDVEIEAGGVIRVADRGSGIPPAEKGAIFERFHRLRGDPSTGAGLGLAIVREIAAAHRGSAQVSARPGGGSVFTLRLGTAG